MNSPPVVDLLERYWLCGALVVGVWLRWGCLWRLGIEHYDEAVYASNLMFGAEGGYAYPGRQYHAPALVPALIEWFTIAWRLVGLPEVSWLPIIPGLLAGTVLIPSAWWIVRRWFSPVAGIAVAWLAALSEFHGFYSRTALTDPWVVLWLLWAVHASWRALETGHLRTAVVAGLLTALAWWTKYSGWLPLAITFAGGLCYVVMSPNRRATGVRWLRVFLVQSVVAFVVWSPVLWDCQVVGGYSAVAANHRGYLRGWSNWGIDWLQQNANISWYRGWGLALATVLIVLAAGTLSAVKTPQQRQRRAWTAAVLLLGLAVSYAGYPIAADLLLGLAAVVSALIAWKTRRLTDSELRAGCLLSAWFAGLFLTTPLYQPYPRLCLPLWLAGAIGAAWWLHRQWGGAPVPTLEPTAIRRSRGLIVVSTVVSVVVITSLGSPVWEPRTAARDAAMKLKQIVKQPANTVVCVYADPGMFFELNRAGFYAMPWGDFRIKPVAQAAETLMVLGLYAEQLGDFPEQWAAEADRYELVTELAAQPSSLVMLDYGTPWDLHAKPALRQRQWKVYRVLR